MTKTNLIKPKNTLIFCLILVPVSFFFAAGVFANALSGINPENQGKIMVYPVSDSSAQIISNLSFYALLPVTIVLAIVALINLKLNRYKLNMLLIGICFVLVGWIVFAYWALSGDYVSV